MYNRLAYLLIFLLFNGILSAQVTPATDTLQTRTSDSLRITASDSLHALRDYLKMRLADSSAVSADSIRKTDPEAYVIDVVQDPSPIITLLAGSVINFTEAAPVEDAEAAIAARDTIRVDREKINYWTKANKVGLNLNEVAFFNWSSGGNNSVSALMHANFSRKYKRELLLWTTNASIKYGVNAQEGREIRKTEDQLEINSNFGYRRDSISNWYYSAKLNFNTQFTYGYRYPNTETPISKFMAPGYAFVGVGTEFSHPKEDFTAYISPVTEKSTFVLDQRMANEGMFGVTPAIKDEEGNIIREGEKIRTEFGFLVSSSFSKEVWKNIGVNNQIRLYSDYLNKFGNVDIDWELNVNLRVNQYVQANVGSHLKYDDDVKIKVDRDGDGDLETGGPKVQFKQLLGVGLVYQF